MSFGAYKEGNMKFTGLEIRQGSDGSIELDQGKYIDDINEIDVPR